MDTKARREALEKTESEIRGEVASSLGRSGRALGAAIARTNALIADRAPRQAIEEAMKEAKRLRWNLEVQREAVGLRNHSEIDLHYPMPVLT